MLLLWWIKMNNKKLFVFRQCRGRVLPLLKPITWVSDGIFDWTRSSDRSRQWHDMNSAICYDSIESLLDNIINGQSPVYSTLRLLLFCSQTVLQAADLSNCLVDVLVARASSWVLWDHSFNVTCHADGHICQQCNFPGNFLTEPNYFNLPIALVVYRYMVPLAFLQSIRSRCGALMGMFIAQGWRYTTTVQRTDLILMPLFIPTVIDSLNRTSSISFEQYTTVQLY